MNHLLCQQRVQINHEIYMKEKYDICNEAKRMKWHINKTGLCFGGLEMNSIINYVKPELIIVSVVLYFIGIGLRQTEKVKNKYIPVILGCAGIVICSIYIMAVCSCKSFQDVAMAVFTAITQGILTAGLSTYVNQLIKQKNKDE